MIDTDKYEGYRPAPWRNTRYDGAGAHHIVDANGKAICTVHPNRATADLITDAPLLLAEVKRLVLVADELYLHIVGEPHMTLDELVEMMWWRDEE